MKTSYREMLIQAILEKQTSEDFTREQLEKFSLELLKAIRDVISND